MDVQLVLNKLKFGNIFQKLCYRILTNCIIRNNIDLDQPARVSMTRKSIFIEINLNHEFYQTESDLQFALLHEASHIAFGHLFIDTSLYDSWKLNISLDASIQPYLNPDIKKVSSVVNHKPGTLYSGLFDIMDKNTWEYIYNNFPKEEEPNNDQTQQQTNENEKGSGSSDSSNSPGSNNDGGEYNNTDSNTNDNEGMSGSGNFDCSKLNYDKIDVHNFIEQPSKAVESMYENIIQEALKDLKINIGSELGKTIIHGLKIYQTSIQKWRKQLSKSVTRAIKIRGQKETWMRPNRRMSNLDIPKPGRKKLYYPRIGVLIDSSGSMLSYVPKVLSHIAGIASIGGIDYLIGGDVEKQFDYKNVSKKQIERIQFKGFGGTLLKNMILELSKRPIDILIGITDLMLIDSDIEMFNKISKRIKIILCVPTQYKKYVKLNSNIQLVEIEED
jgi:predicted metal-dependent peptidase